MTQHVTQLLNALREGDAEALDELVTAVQQELRGLAERHLAHERRDHTLQATALVNEAYVRLVDQRDRDWRNKSQFLAIASQAMRRVLLEHARARVAQKRGDGRQRVTLFEVAGPLEEEPETLIALDEALAQFGRIDPQNARIVELRWFGGLEVSEVAAILELSTRSVERGWRAAAAWLKDRLSNG